MVAGTGSRSVHVRRVIRRHRRVLSATLAAASVMALGFALMPDEPPTQQVVVAASDLASGHELAAGDLRVAHVSAGLIPSDSHHQVDGLLGHVTSGRVSAGEVLTGARLLSGATQAGPGRATLPVRFADPGAASLLRAGQRIAVIASAEDGGAAAQLVTADALVVDVLQEVHEWSAQGDGSPLVVLDVRVADALRLAGSTSSGHLGFLYDTG